MRGATPQGDVARSDTEPLTRGYIYSSSEWFGPCVHTPVWTRVANREPLLSGVEDQQAGPGAHVEG